MKPEKRLGVLRGFLGKGLLSASLLTAAGTHAQGIILADPMRPSNVGEAAPAGEKGRNAAGPGVQMILNSPQRKLALIDGRVVPLGGEARGGTLVGLTDSAAVLSKDGSRDVLLMHPSIDKKPPSRAKRESP